MILDDSGGNDSGFHGIQQRVIANGHTNPLPFAGSRHEEVFSLLVQENATPNKNPVTDDSSVISLGPFKKRVAGCYNARF